MSIMTGGPADLIKLRVGDEIVRLKAVYARILRDYFANPPKG